LVVPLRQWQFCPQGHLQHALMWIATSMVTTAEEWVSGLWQVHASVTTAREAMHGPELLKSAEQKDMAHAG
jgi:hypothetical protein